MPAVRVVVEVFIASVLAGAGLTVTLAVDEKPLAASEAVSVWDPALVRVAEKLRRPLVKVELAGSVADGSLLLKCTVPA